MEFLKSKLIKFSILLLLVSCVEPLDIKTITYENYLVVEAIITNESKNHSIQLSRTFEIDSNIPAPETGATLQIISETKTYNFIETNHGNYLSIVAFSAEEGESYQLNITTKDGKSYRSSQEIVPKKSKIERISTSTETSVEGKKGVSIYVQSFNPTNDTNYYRYQYEETYKIVPPFWSSKELIVISDVRPFEVEIIDRTQDNKICYKTNDSKSILITETKSLAEDRVNFPIRFILENDFIISERYSILVKQFVQSPKAYNYYKTLKELSSSDNVFAQAQPGFIAGNLISNTDPNEKVVGFFEVSSISEKRFFLNFSDVFSSDKPNFPDSCSFVAPILYDSFTGESPLVSLLKDNSHTYYKENDTGLAHLEGRYLLVPKICGDCTILGSNIKPIFWID